MADDRPPFDVPGHEWDPVRKRFFKKSDAEEAAGAKSSPDSRPHRYSRTEPMPDKDGQCSAKNELRAEAGGSDVQLGERAGASVKSGPIGQAGSYLQSLQNLKAGGQHRSHVAQFARTTSTQVANKLRSSACYVFTYLNNSFGATHVQSLCSNPDGTFWVGFYNNIFLAQFPSHPAPIRREVEGIIYGPPAPDDDWTANIRSLPYDRPTDTLKTVLRQPLEWGLFDELFGGYRNVHSVAQLNLIQGTLSATLSPTRIILEGDHKRIIDPSTAQPRLWKPSINKVAYDIPHADMRDAVIRIVPWLRDDPSRSTSKDPPTLRAFACGRFVQVLLLAAPPTNELPPTPDPNRVEVQALDINLPPQYVLPDSPPLVPRRWLLDFHALVTRSDPMAVEISRDARWLLVGLRNGALLLWDLKRMVDEHQEERMAEDVPMLNAMRPGTVDHLLPANRPSMSWPPHLVPTEITSAGNGSIQHIKMASDTDFLVVYSSGEIHLFRFNHLHEGSLRSYNGHPRSLEPLGFAVHRKLRIFAAAGSDGRVRMWSLDDVRPIEPADTEDAPRRRIDSEEEMRLYGKPFFQENTAGAGGAAAGTEPVARDGSALEDWWADSSTVTVMERPASFVAGKLVHQIVFSSPPRTLAWVHRPVQELGPTTEQVPDEALNDASVDEPDVPALAVGCYNVLWFFT